MYREFTPCALLAPFIDKFWVFKGYAEIGTRFKILADGGFHLFHREYDNSRG